MEAIKGSNAVLTFLLEVAMLASFSYFGFHLHSNAVACWLLGVGLPTVVILFWGSYMAPRASHRLTLPLRITTATVLFLLAALALYVSGWPQLAVVLGVVTVVNQALAYLWKQ